MDGTVHALFVLPKKKAPALGVREVQVGLNGFEGDFHAGVSSRRQVLMLSRSVLDEFGLTPGMLSENLVIDGLDVMKLASGQQLRVGDALLEVTLECEPCVQMDRIRPGLRRDLQGKRGKFATVIIPGTIHVGDRVRADGFIS
jgi:MOSC domain-containing protein YiiM